MCARACAHVCEKVCVCVSESICVFFCVFMMWETVRLCVSLWCVKLCVLCMRESTLQTSGLSLDKAVRFYYQVNMQNVALTTTQNTCAEIHRLCVLYRCYTLKQIHLWSGSSQLFTSSQSDLTKKRFKSINKKQSNGHMETRGQVQHRLVRLIFQISLSAIIAIIFKLLQHS